MGNPRDKEHLIVDAYNVMHAVPELRAALRGGHDHAREKLCEWVRVLHDFEGLRTSLVFDGSGETLRIERPTGVTTFSYLFAPSGITADGVIEQIVAASKRPERITVATRDRSIREAVYAVGGSCVTPEDLANRISLCGARQSRKIDVNRNSLRGKWKTDVFSIASRIDEE